MASAVIHMAVASEINKVLKRDYDLYESLNQKIDKERRVNILNKAIEGIKQCLNEGIKINGYFYWSLMDNFEWQKGYSQKFGLVAVDRTSMERTAKKSLYYLGSYNK